MTLNVFAAASLTEAFTELGTVFEADHPGTDVTFNFAGSSVLARQVNEGAGVDVFASADESSMNQVTAAGNAEHPTVIARNRLAILVERGNPKGIRGLSDLARPEVVLVMCAPEAPCGQLAAAALEKGGVLATPASLEENVKGVVSRVTLGEADAGIVYATDVRSAGDRAQGVEIDLAHPALEAVYSMAVIVTSANRAAATAWVELIRSSRGQTLLAKSGFVLP